MYESAFASLPPLSSKTTPMAPTDIEQVARNLALARSLWNEAEDPAGTVVETYLRRRGLQLESSLPLRYHPACPRGRERLPAMLAAMTHPITNEFVGVHRTFLQADGQKAGGQAKMMLGGTGVIRLSADEDVHYAIGIAEGLETSVAVMQIAQWRPVWACGSASGVAAFPLLPGINSLTVWADTGRAGLDAAAKACKRWAAAGLESTMWAPAASDWLDALLTAREST